MLVTMLFTKEEMKKVIVSVAFIEFKMSALNENCFKLYAMFVILPQCKESFGGF